MASSVIGALRVNLGMDTAQFEAGARKAKAEASGLAGALGGFTKSFGAMASGAAVGTVAVAAFTYGMKQAAAAAQYADDISAQAYKLGVSAEYLQAFNHAAEASDVPAETAREALAGLTSAIGALQTKVGDGKIRKAMEALGIPQAQIDSMRSAQDALPILADKIAQLGTVTEQTAFAKKFGIEALLPLLKQGSAGIQGLMDNAKNLGLVLSEDVVQHMADMNERLRVVDQRAKMAGLGLGASFTPALVAMKEAAIDGVRWLDSMIDRLNKLNDRTDATLEKQIGEKKEKLRQQVIHGAGDSGMADYLRGEISNLEEARRNNNRANMRKKTAQGSGVTSGSPAAGNYGGGGSGGGSSKGRGTPEETQAELFAQAQIANDRAREKLASDAFQKTIIDPKTLQDTVTESAAIGLGKAFDQSREDIRADFQYAMEGGLYAAINGGGKGLMQYLADQFKRSMVESLAESLSNVMSKMLANGKGTGPFGAILSAAAGAFGIGANANGTSNWRGGLTWVGERGKELVNLPGGSQVIPNHALGDGGGVRTIRIVTEASPYFDTRVEEVAGPMAVRAAVAGAQSGSQMAEERLARRGRQRFA
jgi:hypothetical protein